MVWFILGIIALIVGAIVTVCTAVSSGKKAATAAGIITVVVVAIFVAVSCIANVPTGHTGVLTTFGKV